MTAISLIDSVHRQDFDAMRQYLGTGKKPEDERNAGGDAAMHVAALHNFSSCVTFLHSNGAQLNVTNKLGWTPLMHASAKGHIHALTTLLRLGADHQIADRNGFTAAALAAIFKNPRCQSLLGRNPETEEFVKRKELAHLAEVDGESQIAGRKFPLSHFGAPLAHDCVATHLRTFASRDSILSGPIKHRILLALQNAAQQMRKTAAMWTRILHSDQLVVLPAGWAGHALNVVIHRCYMAICNRGAGRPEGSQTIACFAIDPLKITPAIVQRILDQKGVQEDSGSCFFYRTLPQLVSSSSAPVQDLFCRRIEAMAPEAITVGVCTTAAAKTAVRVSIALLVADVYGVELPRDFEQMVMRVSKDLSTHMRVQSLRSYCATHADKKRRMQRSGGHISPDLTLIRRCFAELHKRIHSHPTSPLFSRFVADLTYLRRTHRQFLSA